MSSLLSFPSLLLDSYPYTDIEFTIVHHGWALYLYLLPILYYDIQYLVGVYQINCDCDNIIAQCTIVHQRCVLYVYLVPILYYDTQYFTGCNHINRTICTHNNLCPTAGWFFFPIVMVEQIDNTCKISDDNNFRFVHCDIMQCDYVNNICTYINNNCTHPFILIPK